MSWSIKMNKYNPTYLFPKRKGVKREVTRQQVSEATARFLSSGGHIQRIGKERAVTHQMVNEKEWREAIEEWDLN